jgi:hypothetical protein
MPEGGGRSETLASAGVSPLPALRSSLGFLPARNEILQMIYGPDIIDVSN